jgi:hypothetical protein
MGEMPDRIGPPPPASTEAELTGHRCAGGACKCRVEGDPEEQTPPAEGTKRFEVRLQAAPGVAWAIVDGKHRLFKGNGHAEDCFYLDLPPGDHHVIMRAAGEREDGPVGLAFAVNEHNAKGPWWFNVFSLQCGMSSACGKDNLDTWRGEIEADHRQLTDPCGSVKINKLTWDTGRMPDNVHPHDVQVSFTMHVYKKAWDKAPRSPDCKER